MKKIIAILLTVMMILSVAPLAIFAADGATETDVCYIETDGVKTYYDNVNTAIEAAASGSTIVMIKDSSISGYKTINGKALTIDGGDFTLTNTGSGYAFDVAKGADTTLPVTIKNLTLNSPWGLWTNNDRVNIEDCTFNISDGMTLSYAGSDGIVNFTNTVFNYDNNNVKSEPFMRTGNGNANNLTVNMVNSQITAKFGNNTNNYTQNNGLFNVFTTGTFTVNMDAQSSITTDGDYVCSIFSLHKDKVSGFNLNLADGATLKLNNGNAGVRFFANEIAYEKMNIVDNGAKWVVGAAAAKKGVNLPSFLVDGAPSAWSTGEETYSGKWGNANATADTVFTPVKGDNYDYYVYIADADGKFIKEYDTVNNAFKAQVSGQKIMVNGDTLMTGTISTGAYTEVAREVIVEGVEKGEGIKAEITSSSGIADTLSLWNLTLENLVVSNYSGGDMFYFDTWYNGGWQDVHSGGNFTISNCVINNNGPRMFKCRGGASTSVEHGPFNITVKDSTVNHIGAGTMLWANHYALINLKVENSTVNSKNGSVITVDEQLTTGSANSTVNAIFDKSVVNSGGKTSAFYLYTNGKELDVKLTNGTVVNHSGTRAVLQSDGPNAEYVGIALDNSRINSTASYPVGYMGEKSLAKNLTFTLKNNSYVGLVGGSTSQWYSWMFMFEPNSVNSVFDLSVDGTSEIYANLTGAGTAAGILYGCLASTSNINLEKGAIVGIEGIAANIHVFNCSETAYLSAKGTLNLNDNGAIYSIGENAATKGVNLPKSAALKNKTFVGYTDGTSVYSNNKVNSAINYSIVGYTAENYDIIDGASLRTVEGENGLRFTTVVSDDLLALLGNNAEFHTLIASNALLGDAELTAALATGAADAVAIDIKHTKSQQDFVNGETTYDNAYHGAVLLNNEGVEAATLYQTECSARGYFVVTYADGTTATFYTEYDAVNNTRSMLDVAEALNELGGYEDNEVVQGVIAACTANA